MKFVRGFAFASLCLSALLLGAALAAAAQDGITVSEAWARATPPAARTAALYATIGNAGDAPDRLIGFTTDRAEKGEIHEMSMTGGVMRMRPVEGGLVVYPGNTISLAPGGYHGMLTGLTAPLIAGETFRATAVFEHAGRIEIAVPVVAMGAPAPSGHAMDMNQSETKP